MAMDTLNWENLTKYHRDESCRSSLSAGMGTEGHCLSQNLEKCPKFNVFHTFSCLYISPPNINFMHPSVTVHNQSQQLVD